jgi:hypothetical protein
MKKTTLFTFVVIAATAILTSCSKDETTPTPNNNSTATTNLTAKDWKITGLIVSTIIGDFNFLDSMDACQKDNLIKYNLDGSIIEKAGATKCEPTEPDTENGGVWALLNNDTKLRMIDGDTSVYDINTLNSTTAILKQTQTIDGFTTTITMTLKNNQ